MSLALQLFVNINKLILLHPHSGLGSNYARALVERVKKIHPELLDCSDPSNAHTAALSAFALGLGIRDLRHGDAAEHSEDVLAPILKQALDRADEHLEHLGVNEVHLVLMAHEDYKSHCGFTPASRQHENFDRVRGHNDILPMATIAANGEMGDYAWRPRAVSDQDPLHASDIDMGIMELPEISQAMTGEPTFTTAETIELLMAPTHPIETDIAAFPFTDESSMGETNLSEMPSSFTHQAGFAQVTPDTPHLSARTLHPVRSDRLAEREFSHSDHLVGEDVDAMRSRQRMQADLCGAQTIPFHASSWEAANAGVCERVGIKGGVMEESEWMSEDNNSHTSTYLHSESAPDYIRKNKRHARKTIPMMVWGAPTFLLIPPLAIFYAGVLWGREKYGSSAMTLGMGAVGSIVMASWWFIT